MGILEISGYFGALLIGVVLGLIGGGGSILTVPVLVYLLAVNPVTATAYSLFVVGTSSLVGAVNNMKKKWWIFVLGLFFPSLHSLRSIQPESLLFPQFLKKFSLLRDLPLPKIQGSCFFLQVS